MTLMGETRLTNRVTTVVDKNNKNSNYIGTYRQIFHTFALVKAVVTRLHNFVINMNT